MSPLFSADYIAMALSNKMRMERGNVNVKWYHKFLSQTTIVGYYLLWPLSKIPIIRNMWEMTCRCWGQDIIGFFIRSAYYKVHLRSMGTNVFFDYGVHIWCPENVIIGDDVHLDTGVVIWGSDGYVNLGSRINIGCYSLIQGRGGVVIENDCGIAPHVAIYSSTHYQWFPDGRRMAASPMSKDEQYIKTGHIKLRHHSYVKYGSLITHGSDGVEIGPYGFVLPNSLVKDNVPAEEMWGGQPAKKIGDWRETRTAKELLNESVNS